MSGVLDINGNNITQSELTSVALANIADPKYGDNLQSGEETNLLMNIPKLTR